MTSSSDSQSTPGIARDQALDRHGGKIVGADVASAPP
jgi:hypothetical protein